MIIRQNFSPTHKYLTHAGSVVQRNLSQHQLCQKQVHDNKGTTVELQIGDLVWLCTPVVARGNTIFFGRDCMLSSTKLDL